MYDRFTIQTSMRVIVYVCMIVWLYACLRLRVYVCVFVCVCGCVCMSVYMYVCNNTCLYGLKRCPALVGHQLSCVAAGVARRMRRLDSVSRRSMQDIDFCAARCI